jgi:two-component system response regulator NreC
MHNIRLIIADDHELFRNGLAELLRKQSDLEIVCLAKDGQELLDQLASGMETDIILLDISMPNINGFEILQELQISYPALYSIILSMHDDGNYIAKCAKYGAHGYLLKNADEEELIKAIHQVNEGKKYFPPDITERMINTIMKEEVQYKHLSKKESEVLLLLSEGFTTKEIADRLFISTRTVETHRANILKKLKVKNTAELIKKATSLGLI